MAENIVDIAPELQDASSQQEGDSSVAGKPIDKVELAIDYAIIEHFSKHLYGSPNKAVEELVANSFDAFAYRAYVYIPGGGQVEERIVVWDDGDSMDVEALKKLWWIARSPKNDGSDREQTSDGRTRKLIGKFGIGKLASYAIGQRITHLCKRDGRFLVVGVDYGQIEAEMADKEPGSATYTSTIYELGEDEAIAWIDGCFAGTPNARAEFVSKDAFTVAVVDKLRDVRLTPGFLSWVLGNGMPLRPDFEVYVNDAKVEPGLGQHATTRWNLSEAKLVQSIKNAWNEAKAQAGPTVEGEFVAAEEPDFSPTGEKRPVLVFPQLGRVSVDVMLFEKSLHREGESRDERSYGFFVMVRDRLLNVEDAELFLSPPSYGTFYRAQFVIHADALDQDLLADRERLSQNIRSRELAVIQQGVYRAARAEIERQDDEREEAEKFVHLLPVSSRSLFRDPVVALLVRDHEDGEMADFDFGDPRVVREDLNVDDPVVVLDATSSQFQVNAAHPFIRTLREQLGSSKAAVRAMRAIETLAVSERLLEGYLIYEIGLTAEQAAKVAQWREDLLRSLAVRYSSSADEVKAEVRNASFKGKDRFENALADLFSHMGYVAERRGAAGDEDVLVIGPTGENEMRFIVEGKGSKNRIANDAAELASAKSHAKNAGATAALVVAREFVGFAQKEEPAVLLEAQAVSDEIAVSPVTVEALLALYDAVEKYAYPLETILPVLAEIESPSEKLERISQLTSPIEHFDSRHLLDLIWQEQQGDASGDWVPYRTLWQKHYKDELTIEEFEIKLGALDSLAGGLMTLRPKSQLVVLRQSPDKVAEHVQRGLG